MTNQSETANDDVLDLKKIFFILQKWLWLLIVGAVLSATAAYFFSIRQTPVYQATTNILVARNSSQQTVGDISQSLNLTQLVETYVRMMGTDEFLRVVSQKIGYTIQPDAVEVSGLPNTQVIELKVQDEDSARAALIADTMVSLLRERNETLQAGRYAEAEQSLAIQIADIEAKIAEVQFQLDKAKTDALLQQIAQAQTNIDETVNKIKITQSELDRMNKMDWTQVGLLLSEQQDLLAKARIQLDLLATQLAALESRISPGANPTLDTTTIDLIKKQISDLNQQEEQTRQSILTAQEEIAFLTPLQTEDSYKSTLLEKENTLKTQESLLLSFQNLYTNLLSTEEVKRSTNEIDGIKRSLDLYQEIYLGLLSNREDIKKQKLQNIPTVEQISPAQPSEKPVKPRTMFNTLLAGLSGLVLAGVFVLLREAMDDTIKTHGEVEKLLGARVLGYVMGFEDEDDNGIHVGRFPRSPVADAFRTLRTNLEFASKERPIKSIIVTSGNPTEGKTTIAANLAASFSHLDKKVILIDADMRRPRIHFYTGVSNTPGLSDLLDPDGKLSLEDCCQSLEILPNLQIISSGDLPPNPTDLLCSPKMDALIQKLASLYDYLIIDAPPMFVADPQVLQGLADGVLLVMVPGQTKKEVVRAIQEQTRQTGVRVLGVVFNRLSGNGRSGYYSDTYYYASNYYYSTHPGGKKGRAKKETSHSGDKINLGKVEHHVSKRKSWMSVIVIGILAIVVIVTMAAFYLDYFGHGLGLTLPATPLPTGTSLQ